MNIYVPYKVSRYRIILLLVLSFVMHGVDGQNTMRFERFSTLDGLGNNSIFDVAADSRGFIWFATYDGLSRYDGYEFVNYKPDQSNPGLMGSNIINVLAPDSLGQIWFGTAGTGLSVFNPGNGDFSNYQSLGKSDNGLSGNNVSAICHTENKVWIGTTAGLDILNTDTDSISSYSLAQFGVSDAITFLLKGDDGTVWVGTSTGIVLVKLKNNHLEIHPSFAVLHSDFSRRVNHILRTDHDQYWLVYPNMIRCIRLNNDKGITELFKLNANEVLEQTGVRPIFNSIVQGSGDRYFVATSDGLLKLDFENEDHYKLTRSSNELFNNESLSGNQVISLCKDREGVIWMGTRFNGINKYDPFKQPFVKYMRREGESTTMHSNDVRALLEDRKGHIWIGYRNEGLDCYQPNTGTYQHFEYESSGQDGLPSNTIRGLYEDRQGQLWLGSSAGLSRITRSASGYRFETITTPLGEVLGTVYAFFEDSRGLFWLGTPNGLFQYDSLSNTVKFFRDDKRFLNRRTFIRCIAEDNKGNLWLATDGAGIDKLVWETGEFVNYRSELNNDSSLSHNKVYSLLFDSKDRLWVGTHSGLDVMDETTGQFTSYTESDGLVNNVVYSVLEDDLGYLWVSTANGLSRLSPDERTFNNYLQSFEFSDDAWLQNDDGMILMGGLNGFFRFHPARMIDNKLAPKVYVNRFSLQNKQLKKGDEVNGRVLLDVPVSEIKKIELEHEENFFSLELLALSLSKPDQISYQYQLEGFNSSWIDADHSGRTAVFTNVPFGNYAFKYRAANADGVWSEQAALPIVIHPAYYQTTLFKVVLGLFLILLIVIGYRLRLRNLTLQKQRLQREVEAKTKALRLKKEAIEKQNEVLEDQKREIEEQRDKVVEMTRKIHETDERKIRFFTSISHEIRTPLTLIAGPIERLIDSMTATDSRFEGVQMVQRNTHRLMRLVNQLLDFRKMDAGHMPIRTMLGDLAAFITELFNSFENLAHKKQIHYTLHITSDLFEICFDSDALEKIVTNLISNALKYTPDGGVVTVHLERSTMGAILFSVKDNGPGIPADQSDTIFNRFYRDNKQQHSNGTIGTGIGLALAKELAIMHGGDIKVEANREGGSCFQLTLPALEEEEGTQAMLDQPLESLGKLLNSAPQTTEKYSVLIIEDNADLRSFIKESIDSENIIEAENGDDGLNLAMEQLPDIIISDVLMPGKNGYEVCRLLKQDARTNHIPIILLTALGAEENQQIGINSGADDYIVKPFNHRILSGKIRNIMLARQRFKETLQIGLTNADSSTQQQWKQSFPLYVSKIIDLIETHMHQRSFGVEELGSLMGMSRSTLYRKLKTVTDKTAVEFIREVKMRNALELLLKDKHLQLAELAFQVGFEDVDYFRQCFKKQFGKTPKEFV